MRIGFLSENFGRVDFSFNLDATGVMSSTGLNTGNLAFWYSAFNMVTASNDIVRFSWNASPAELKNKVDILLLPVANFLSADNDLQILADIVTGVDKPCIMFGLGAQSESEGEIPQLKGGTINFLREVAKRTESIFVRGEYSKAVCSHYGVENVKVVGCPSIFINGNRSLGPIVESKINHNIESLAIHAACLKGSIFNVERELARLCQLYRGCYVIQRPEELIKVINNETLLEDDYHYIRRFHSGIFPHLSEYEFLKFMNSQGYYFTDIPSWISFLKRYTHAIGTRIHGSILALSAYIPSVCITHDTRTRELSKVLNVPNISEEQFKNAALDMRKLYSEVDFDGKSFETNRSELARNYFELFDRFDIKPSPHFENFR